jgi:hypothetical protein
MAREAVITAQSYSYHLVMLSLGSTSNAHSSQFMGIEIRIMITGISFVGNPFFVLETAYVMFGIGETQLSTKEKAVRNPGSFRDS